MTVDELIAILRGYPADLPVLVEGYESGWDAIAELRPATVTKIANAQDWGGEYCEPGKVVLARGEPDPEFGPPEQVLLVLGRRGARRSDEGGGQA